MSLFRELSQVVVNEYTEKKGQFTYLSWAFAVQELLKRVPDAEWEMPEPSIFPDGTMMVWCKLTANGITRTAYLPVTDNRNNAIKNPNAFQINTSMQRCLAKAIALHGLGLYIYAGEDLPQVTDYDIANQKLDAGEPLAFMEWVASLPEETITRVYNDAPSGFKVKFKARFDDELRKAEAIIAEYHSQIVSVIEQKDAMGFKQLWGELNQMTKDKIKSRLNQFELKTATDFYEQKGEAA